MPSQRMDTPTTTVERWGLTPGRRIWVGGHNTSARAAIESLLAGMERPAEGPIDIGFITPATAGEAVHFAGKLRPRLGESGTVWIIYPLPRAMPAGSASFSIDEAVVGLFELGFTEIGQAPVNNELVSSGFRAGGGIDEAPEAGPGGGL
jgi:hypothetical protein